ncbi:MAG: glycosyltransferase [Acidimicrobiia bacterium]|nr:glycosyltransferase [Acidimicrobiia bacterium]
MNTGLDRDIPEPRFDHLAHMTEPFGLWEHALYSEPRQDHGYCTDDNARALIVASRQPGPSAELIELAEIYVRFLEDAQIAGGGFHNRRNKDGSWEDAIGSDDSQGRAIWALGTAAASGPEPWMRDLGLSILSAQSGFSSPFPRSNAFAMLGASEALAVAPGNLAATQILERSLASLVGTMSAAGTSVGDPVDEEWPWPEDRLTYDNARIPEALLAAGEATGDDQLVNSGLALLEWLVAVETNEAHFSFTPVGGWTRGEPRPGFDQQPVEATAMADACARAWRMTGDLRWRAGVEMAARWFLGANDIGVNIYDSETGGSGDGLTSSGVNENQGAESTLAALASLQQARAIEIGA